MFALGTFHHGFPSAYHPDEPAKVAQLVADTRDYHHPPLMLTLADAVARAGGVAREPEALARIGRTLSALYLAGAVAGLVVLAAIYGRTRAAVVTAAVALGLDAQAVLAAHFFKEDALFVLALAGTFVAGAVHWRRRGTWDRLALGAAAGLAVSAKYVGALAVVYALVLVMLAAGKKRRVQGAECKSPGVGSRKPEAGKSGFAALHPAPCTLHFALSALAVVLLCNGAALRAHGAEIVAGWRLGVSTVQAGNGGVGARVPHLQFVGMLFLLTPLPILAGAAVFWADLRRFPFRAHADRWLAGLSPLWLTLVFSFSASTAARYFLPVSLMMGCIAGVALPGAVRRLAGRSGRWSVPLARPFPAACLAAGLVAAFALPGTCSLLAGFAGDDRAALTAWIEAHLPPDAVLAQDALARLPADVHGRRVESAPVVADLGDVAALRARGVGYVVVCWYDSRRYTDPRKHASPDAHDFLRRREFYQGLPTHARSLWRSDLRQPFPLCPGLELFALDP